LASSTVASEPFAAASPRASPPPAAPAAPPPHPVPAAESTNEIFAILERLAELHGKGILSEDEFATKKAELLARL
jgi:Short C-terminal domain